MNVKKAVAAIQAQLDLTQTGLAEAMCIAQPTLWAAIEKNAAATAMLNRLARVSGLKISQVVALGEELTEEEIAYNDRVESALIMYEQFEKIVKANSGEKAYPVV